MKRSIIVIFRMITAFSMLIAFISGSAFLFETTFSGGIFISILFYAAVFLTYKTSDFFLGNIFDSLYKESPKKKRAVAASFMVGIILLGLCVTSKMEDVDGAAIFYILFSVPVALILLIYGRTLRNFRDWLIAKPKEKKKRVSIF